MVGLESKKRVCVCERRVEREEVHVDGSYTKAFVVYFSLRACYIARTCAI